VDVTPQLLGDPNAMGRFGQVLDLMAADPDVDAILFVQSSTEPTGREIAQALAEHRDRSPKPLLVTWSAMPQNARETLLKAQLYVFPSQARAIQAIATLAGYAERAPLVRTRTEPNRQKPVMSWPEADVSKGPLVLTEDIVSSWLDYYGIARAQGRFASGEDEAAAAAKELGYPVVAKVISEGIAHRSKYNLVALDILDEAELRQKCAEFRVNAKEKLGLTTLDGFFVQQYRPKGLELILGGFKSPPFGHVMVCGIGGYLAEFFQPVYRLLPIDEAETEQMLAELPFLRKYPEEIDRAALKDVLLRFSYLLKDCPWEQFELELNPVKVLPKGQGVIAVDGLAIIKKV
jgi:acyl-CoA synthetase (NDP forming)